MGSSLGPFRQEFGPTCFPCSILTLGGFLVYCGVQIQCLSPLSGECTPQVMGLSIPTHPVGFLFPRTGPDVCGQAVIRSLPECRPCNSMIPARRWRHTFVGPLGTVTGLRGYGRDISSAFETKTVCRNAVCVQSILITSDSYLSEWVLWDLPLMSLLSWFV